MICFLLTPGKVTRLFQSVFPPNHVDMGSRFSLLFANLRLNKVTWWILDQIASHFQNKLKVFWTRNRNEANTSSGIELTSSILSIPVPTL